MSNKELELRVDELESRLAFFEDSHQQLDDIVIRQDETISLLQAQLQQLAKRLGDVAYSVEGSSSAGQDRPPHY